jgi:hypothetical protein
MKKILFSVLALGLGAQVGFAQIPNNSFENWSNSNGYNTPDGWDNLNNLTNNAMVYTCEKGTPGNVGSSYLKLTSKTVSGMGVMPGVAVSGKLNSSNFTALSGFPYNQQPTALTGKWQHMIYGADDATHQGFIDVQLTHWDIPTNSRTVVGSAHKTLSGMAMTWSTFTLPIIYTQTTMPDSAIIVFSASGTVPTNLDYLWVDNISFTGTSTAIHELNTESFMSVYPNPCTDKIAFATDGYNGNHTSVRVCDIAGKELMSLMASSENNLQEISVADLPAGMYVLYVTDQNKSKHALFSKN